MIVAPSLLAADFADLKKEIQSVSTAGAEWLHVDVMDGVFVSNISVGLPIVKACRDNTTLFLDVHLMIVQPEKYVEAFALAGADLITFHIEATHQVSNTIQRIRASGKKVGLSLRPGTPIEALEPFLDAIDLALVMTVEPGFGGQSFQPEQLSKVAWLKKQRHLRHLNFLIEVDGGIQEQTASLCEDADVLVAGTYVFKAQDRNLAIQKLKTAKVHSESGHGS